MKNRPSVARACLLPLVCLLLAGVSEVHARVDVSLDAATLSDLLAAMAPSRVSVPLTQGRGVTLLLQDLKVTGFDPTEGEKSEGSVLTSVRVKIPELGIDLPVEPRLSLQVRDRDGTKICFLKFERVPIQLPITGTIDVAPLLPILPLPGDSAFTVGATSGEVRVRTRLIEAKMGVKLLRLGFELDVSPVAKGNS